MNDYVLNVPETSPMGGSLCETFPRNACEDHIDSSGDRSNPMEFDFNHLWLHTIAP